jgi:hypothetical protein
MATVAPIVNVRNIDASKVSFSEPRKNAKGGTSVQIRYDGQSFQLRIPKMKYPGGVFVREDDNTGKVDYKLIGSLAGCDPYNAERAPAEAGEFGKLYNFLHDLEEKLINAAVANSPKWFGKTRSEAGVRDSFKQLLSVSSEKGPDGNRVPNGKYPPSFAVKIPVYDGQVKMQVIDAKGNPVYMTTDNIPEVFPKRVEANLVISPSIYVVNASFGISWRVEYAQVFPTERTNARSVFMEDDDAPAEESAPAGSAQDAFAEEAPPPEESKPEPPSVPASRRKRAVA